MIRSKCYYSCTANYDIIIWIRHQHGWTPLHYACQNGDIETMEYLMKYGAHNDMQDEYVSDDS